MCIKGMLQNKSLNMTANCLYLFLFMQTFMLTLGKLAIETNCNVKGSSCTISCSIPEYEKLASWRRENKIMTSCTETSFCTTQSTLLYSFIANETGIYVVISDLTSNENGIKWTCTHGVDTPVSISINIPERGKLTIETNCNVKGSSCTIFCSIPEYEKLASWSRENKIMTSCSETSFCTTQSTLLYSFIANETGIYVVISDLTSNENGIKWTCTHGLDTPVSISINIPERDHIDESGLAGGSIAGIVIGVLVPVIIGIIIIVLLVLRKQNPKNDHVQLNENNE